MRAGRFDRRITIEQVSRSQNPLGEEPEIWTPMATVWASKVLAKADEGTAAQETAAQMTYVFTIRWLAGIDPGRHRINFEGRIWDIFSAVEIGRRRGVRILAAARAD